MKISYVSIPLDKIIENSRNPNEMTKAKYKALVGEIKRDNGNYAQPLSVRPIKDGMYEIIDGAHRYRALKENWFKEAMCEVKKIKTEKAMMKTVSMDNLRGRADPVSLAVLIGELKDKYEVTDTELIERLGIGESELEEYNALKSFAFDSFSNVLDVVSELETKDLSGKIISLPMTTRDLEILSEALKMLPALSKPDIIVTAANYVLKNASILELTEIQDELKGAELEEKIVEDFMENM